MGKIRRTLALSAFAVSALSSQVRAETLVVNSYGGPYEAIIRKTIIEPFEARTGIDVIYDAVGSASQDYAKIKATKGRPGFDVVVMTASQSLQGCQDGVLAKLDATSIPNLSRLSQRISATAGPCGAVHEVQYMSLLYRKDKIAAPPASWSALASDELKGKIVLPTFQNIMAIYLVQMFSLMNGGGLVDNLDPGFKAMSEVARRSIGFEQSSAILESYIKDGTVWAMPFWNGRAQLLVDSGLPVDYVRPKEGTIPLIATLNIPSGAEHKDAAAKFIDFFLGKESQEAWVRAYKVGTARMDIDLPADIRARQITSEADLNSLILPDLTIMSERLSKWAEQWERDVVANAN
ncbi:ABC transporter substrate-binding protein [Rhizobium mesoamericanum]|uniref:Extracellular solute-binding protein family 1 n=1 Tax=Rhizobium mesoamericanum STM3625 TaxID=1211777 RepID=K0Q3M4_9HYPH|nr:ABC transporter substrate-binding protein [Rhizobium mesoamericanum]CCM79470.1 Extracellular solute-binding protein family 1 [Rhizobium mesoamericanum STM3625]